jgi:hypothetical protein
MNDNNCSHDSNYSGNTADHDDGDINGSSGTIEIKCGNGRCTDRHSNSTCASNNESNGICSQHLNDRSANDGANNGSSYDGCYSIDNDCNNNNCFN